MAASTLGSAWLVTNDGNVLNKKPKRLVKHKKKTWRVTEVGDVDRFLESQRLDERLGGPLSDRPDDSIFIVDTQQENEISKSEVSQRKRSKDIGPLKCHSILTSSSAVPDPLVKRNHVRTADERADPLILKIKEERRAQGKIPRKYVQSMKDRQKSQEIYAKKQKPERLRTNFDFDLWGDKGEELVIGDKAVVFADLPDDVKKYTLDKMGKRIYSRPDTMFKKTTALPAVEVPHPGASYNPTYQDHQHLLKKACLKEAKEIKQEKRVTKAIAPMLKKVSPVEKEKAWMSEMSQGLDDDEDERGEEALSMTNLARSTKPKTEKQKKKAKLLKFKEHHRLQLKETKKRMLALERLRSIRREIRKAEEEAVKRAEQRKKEKDAKLSKPAVLGRYKYEAPPVEVNLSDEIAGTLRGLKTEGNLLIDRYKSLQRRNIVEPRIRHRVVYKYKHKVFIKRSYSTPQGLRVGHKNINTLLNKK